MQYQITTTGKTFPINELGAHFPNVSLPAILDADTLAGLGLVLLPDPPPTDAEIAAALVQAKADSWTQIKAIRDSKTQTGGYQAAGKWFHSDTFSRTQQIGLVLMGASIPSALEWKTMDGSFIVMTQTLAGQIFAAAGAQDMALFAHAEALKTQVDAAADPAAVDLNAGWPVTFSNS